MNSLICLLMFCMVQWCSSFVIDGNSCTEQFNLKFESTSLSFKFVGEGEYVYEDSEHLDKITFDRITPHTRIHIMDTTQVKTVKISKGSAAMCSRVLGRTKVVIVNHKCVTVPVAPVDQSLSMGEQSQSMEEVGSSVPQPSVKASAHSPILETNPDSVDHSHVPAQAFDPDQVTGVWILTSLVTFVFFVMITVAIYKQVKKYRDNKRQPNNVDSCESSLTVYNMGDFVNQKTPAITIEEHEHQL